MSDLSGLFGMLGFICMVVAVADVWWTSNLVTTRLTEITELLRTIKEGLELDKKEDGE